MPAMPTWLKRAHTTTKDTGLILRGGGINSRVVVYACQLGPHGRSEAAVVHHYGENNARGLKDACAFKCDGATHAEAEGKAVAWVQGEAMRGNYLVREDIEAQRRAHIAKMEYDASELIGRPVTLQGAGVTVIFEDDT